MSLYIQPTPWWAKIARRRRMKLFWQLVSTLPAPQIQVLDLGGVGAFWQTYGLLDHPRVRVCVVNLEPHPPLIEQVQAVVADARHLDQWTDNSVDIVFSNSLIEHLGDLTEQRQFAREICRVARNYFVQTPNYGFPLEPHFMFPCFQYFPLAWQVRLVQSFKLGWLPRLTDREQAVRAIKSIRLLKQSELQQLFPEAFIWRENMAGLTKSLIAIGGDWSRYMMAHD